MIPALPVDAASVVAMGKPKASAVDVEAMLMVSVEGVEVVR